MNATDLALLAQLTSRTRDLVCQLQRLAVYGAPATEAFSKQLDALWADVGGFTNSVQDAEARSWRADHPPRHPAPPRLTATNLPLSTELDPDAPVKRFGLDGKLKTQETDVPRLSGRWQNERWGKCR